MNADDVSAQSDGEATETANSACSACFRRKLRCDRKLDGCSTCLKSDIPCIYDAHLRPPKDKEHTRAARRKPRGPYKKGKTPREKELEHLVELLQERLLDSDGEVHHQTSDSIPTRSGVGHGSPSNLLNRTSPGLSHAFTLSQSSRTQSTTNDIHPPPDHILALWLIYTASCDVYTKIVHRPTVTKMFLHSSNHTDTLDPPIEALMISIYLAAINSLEQDEVSSRFNVEKSDLITIYQSALNNLLRAAESSDSMSLEMMQATVIYLACLRRQPGPGADIPSLFTLAVAFAERLGLNNINTYATVSPFEAEMRRRAWWMICRHESAYAEEYQRRKSSIMEATDIPFPMNYNDEDLDSSMESLPVPRKGLTDMSFALLALENVRMTAQLVRRVQSKKLNMTAPDMKRSRSLTGEARDIWESTKRRLEQDIFQYCDYTRPFDWLLLLASKIVLTKTEIMLLESPSETDTVSANAFQELKVSLSLDVIECHELLLTESRLEKYRFNYRNVHQWFAMIFVLEEVAKRPDADLASRVWQVIDTVLVQPDLLNKHGMKAEDRMKLLDAHGRALEAREALLLSKRSVSSQLFSGLEAGVQQPGGPTFEVVNGSEASEMRIDPWQLDQSLFDVQGTQLNFDAFFWPSPSQEINSLSHGVYDLARNVF